MITHSDGKWFYFHLFYFIVIGIHKTRLAQRSRTEKKSNKSRVDDTNQHTVKAKNKINAIKKIGPRDKTM